MAAKIVLSINGGIKHESGVIMAAIKRNGIGIARHRVKRGSMASSAAKVTRTYSSGWRANIQRRQHGVTARRQRQQARVMAAASIMAAAKEMAAYQIALASA